MNLAIKGHATRGKEVIEILEMLGGKNDSNFGCGVTSYIYSIDEKGTINWYIPHPDSLLAIFTLEEFLEKFPYKVGDRVLYKTYGIYSKIKSMLWNEEKEQVIYLLDLNKLFVATADELQPYKEQETMTQETFKQLIEAPSEGKKEFLDKVCTRGVIQRSVKIALQYPDLAQEYLDSLPKAIDQTEMMEHCIRQIQKHPNRREGLEHFVFLHLLERCTESEYKRIVEQYKYIDKIF